MNINQNFKNQLWAAQNGTPNARVRRENYITWISNRRQVEISGLASRCANDTLGFETDSLINYLENSAILDDRIIRFGLCMQKNDLNTAYSELDVINSLTDGLRLLKQQQIEDFANIAKININTLLSDSITDSLINANQEFIDNVASSEFHFAQADAKALLEKAGIQQEYHAWLPDGMATRRVLQIKETSEESDICQKLIIFPNPSNGDMLIKYELFDENTYSEIRLSSNEGKILNSYNLTEIIGEVHINCTTCINGNYILSLYINGNLECSKTINIIK